MCMSSPLLFVVAFKCMKCNDVKGTYNQVLLRRSSPSLNRKSGFLPRQLVGWQPARDVSLHLGA